MDRDRELNSLEILPKEIIYKLMTYLDKKNYYHVSRISKYYKLLNLPRFIINNRLLDNFGDKDDINEFMHVYRSYMGYRNYLFDIYSSIFLEDLEPTKKPQWSSIINTKRPFDTRNFRRILYYNDFKRDYKSEIKKTAKINSIYRIDMISFLKLRQNHRNILALIY